MNGLRTRLLVFGAAGLLALSAAAPRLRADSNRGAEPMWPVYWECTVQLDSGGGSRLTLPPYSGITQPFPITGNIAACSLKVDRTYSFGVMELVQWDPAQLLPDPTTVALRSKGLDASNLAWGELEIRFWPPLVTLALPHVAQPPTAEAAMTYRGTYPGNMTSFRYDPSSSSTLPGGYYQSAGGAQQPLPGAHAVNGFTLCGGDAALQGLRIVQGVVQTDHSFGLTTYELIQRFRVPRAVRMQWVEIAVNNLPVWPYEVGTIAIHGPVGPGEPPLELPPARVKADFAPYPATPSWQSPFDFDSTMVLLPNTDYWLRVTPSNTWEVRGHAITGLEGADFTAGIGPLWTRTAAGEAWTPETGLALSFKVIGDTTNLLGVGEPPLRSPLELRASPNPSRGASVLSWNGAAGAVRLEVLDARGRRVASHTGGAAGAGQWTWSMAGSGKPLPAGLYFVRATDSQGNAAVARVALIR